MAEAKLRYAVILTNPEHLDVPRLAEALARFNKVAAVDAAPAARRSWGIVADDLEKGRAEALAAELARSGLEGLALPNNLIEDLPQIRPVKAYPEKFAAKPWALVAAAGFRKTVTAAKTQEGPSMAQKAFGLGLMMTTGLPVGLGGGKKEAAKTQESFDLVFYLDLLRLDAPERLRIDAQDFDYSCLNERKDYNVINNFRTLVKEIALGSPEAFKSRGTSVILENKPVSAMGYDALEDLEKESRWLLTLRTLKASS